MINLKLVEAFFVLTPALKKESVLYENEKDEQKVKQHEDRTKGHKKFGSFYSKGGGVIQDRNEVTMPRRKSKGFLYLLGIGFELVPFFNLLFLVKSFV